MTNLKITSLLPRLGLFALHALERRPNAVRLQNDRDTLKLYVNCEDPLLLPSPREVSSVFLLY